MNLLAAINEINPKKRNLLPTKNLSPIFQALLVNLIETQHNKNNVVLCNIEDKNSDCILTFKIKGEFRNIRVTGMTSINDIKRNIEKYL